MKLQSWNRFKTWGLSVAPSLLASSTTFLHNGVTITIKIPSIERLGRCSDEDALVCCSTRSAATGEPLSFHIRAVDVVTVCPSEVGLPGVILERSPKAVDILDVSTIAALDKATEAATEIAVSGFLYWVSLLRWVTGHHRICRELRVGSNSGWSTYLHEICTNHPVWASTQIVSVPFEHRITPDEWQQVQNYASCGTQPPMHVLLLQDAKHCLDVDDFRRAIVDLCMASEVFLRKTVVDALPPGVPEVAVRVMEEANINQFITHLYSSLLTDTAREEYKKSIMNDLKSLFSRRNKLMHVADFQSISRQQCNRYQKAVDALFQLELNPRPQS